MLFSEFENGKLFLRKTYQVRNICRSLSSKNLWIRYLTCSSQSDGEERHFVMTLSLKFGKKFECKFESCL